MNFKAIRELFYFTQKERRGIIALVCLIIILLAIHIGLPYFYRNKPVDASIWENEVNQYLAKQEKVKQQAEKTQFAMFDPNVVNMSELINMGLPAKVASNWIKYLEKGGRFKKKGDVSKIYGMTPVLFDQLDKYILLPEEVTKIPVITKTLAGVRKTVIQRHDTLITAYRPSTKNRVVTKIETVELNTADSVELVKLPGIGPVLAPRIIRYRNLLGGYYSVNQLHEVYGLREEHFTSASPYLNIDTVHFRKFNLNFATISELGRHPYIGFKAARKIIKLRDDKGKYSSPDDLSGILSKDSLNKLIPYLTFNQ
jgi:competence protein ComEA